MAKTAARAMSLHIGLNSVSPKHCEGWSGPLAACEFDANDMAAIAASRGIAAKKLMIKNGTRKAVLAGLRAAAKPPLADPDAVLSKLTVQRRRIE